VRALLQNRPVEREMFVDPGKWYFRKMGTYGLNRVDVHAWLHAYADVFSCIAKWK